MSLKLWIDYAVDDLNDLLEDAALEDADSLEEQIFGLADSNTPIYHSDILECASDDCNLFLTRPDLATEETIPIDMIQLNIFERIEQALWERFREWKEEQEEIELESDPEE